MAKTSIEWTEYTWNPVTGCSVISPGCTNCYAMKLAGGRLRGHPSRAGLTHASKAGPVWTGEVRLNADWLDQPLRWTRPRRIFVCAHGDLFHEAVPTMWIALVYAHAIAAHHHRGHVFQILTKRAARARELLNTEAFWDEVNAVVGALVMDLVDPLDRRSDDARATCDDYDARNPPPGVWLGVSVEDQPRADERVPELLATPAAVRFVSYEPALGPVDFGDLDINGEGTMDALKRRTWGQEIAEGWRGTSDTWEEDFLDWFSLREMPDPEKAMHRTLDWVICGGESGPGARPMHPDWARQVRDDCAAAGVPFFFKQWGAWTPGENVTRKTGVVAVASYDFDRWFSSDEDLSREDGHVDDEPDVYRVGKAAAGRRLDGVTHDAMPEAPRHG